MHILSLIEKIQPIIENGLASTYVVLFNAVVLLIFFSSIDDFAVDCIYVLRRIYRRIVVAPRIHKASDKSLAGLRKQQKAFAICVPAWDESAVIAQMLERAVRDIRYDNYRLFVGVYRNDPATRQAVEALRARNGDCRHRIIIVDHPAIGPTSKADCLNTLYAHVRDNAPWAREQRVAGFILHDAEDIIHPSELVIFNHLIDRADIIQLPVIPLARPLFDLVGGHYQDDFAENHTKDLVVREALGCGVPSAGVGCAFSREALESLAMLRGGQPFDKNSVTEDYDVALELCGLGFRGIFVRLPSMGGKRTFVATQEYFPNTFRTAAKQKSRWLLGIALESWTKRGWSGSLAERYMLWRDRKSILSAMTTAAGYALFVIFILAALREGATMRSQMAALAPEGSIVRALIWINLFFLANRVLQRFTFVYRSYGLLQALISPLRIVVGNAINFAAAWQAVTSFHRAQTTGQGSDWGKTNHQIPQTDAIIAQPGERA